MEAAAERRRGIETSYIVLLLPLVHFSLYRKAPLVTFREWRRLESTKASQSTISRRLRMVTWSSMGEIFIGYPWISRVWPPKVRRREVIP